MGFLETVQSLELEKNQREQYFDMMMSQAQRMKSLVEDLLTLANLEANSLPAATNQVNVETLMALLKNDAEALSHGNHSFTFEVLNKNNLLGDEREILSAFSNLVSNAIRYTPEAGAINVKWIVNADGQGEFSVTDTGPGIASEHLSRLTERFYRIDRSRSRDTGGTGLGMSIMNAVIERHKGTFTLRKSELGGLAIEVHLPRT
jgi:two-component system phosphate regulon sensor histidine kinase PhoR